MTYQSKCCKAEVNSMTVEYAQDNGLMPKVNCFQKMNMEIGVVSNAEYFKRQEEIFRKYDVGPDMCLDICQKCKKPCEVEERK